MRALREMYCVGGISAVRSYYSRIGIVGGGIAIHGGGIAEPTIYM
jgi:hypothetical protein